MFDSIICKAIREHCKKSDYLSEFKGLKVKSSKFREVIKCYDGTALVKFDVTCTTTAKEYRDKVVLFQVNIYDNPTGEHDNTIGVYFDGTEYM